MKLSSWCTSLSRISGSNVAHIYHILCTWSYLSTNRPFHHVCWRRRRNEEGSKPPAFYVVTNVANERPDVWIDQPEKWVAHFFTCPLVYQNVSIIVLWTFQLGLIRNQAQCFHGICIHILSSCLSVSSSGPLYYKLQATSGLYDQRSVCQLGSV